MTNPQRGVYQPLGDNIPLYDLTDEEIEEERSRLPLLIVIALIVLAAFTAVVWLAYNQGVAHGRSSAETVVNPPEGPVRTAPEDANAAAGTLTGLKIYGQQVPPDKEAQDSRLAPSQGSLDGSSVQILRQAPAEQTTTTEAPPARLDPPPAPAAKPAPAPKAPAVVANTAAAVGGVLLQIGSYESPEIASGAWATFKARHAAIVGSLSQDVQKADLGAKGTWYRLRFGPFADKAAANAACEKLKAEGGTCLVASP
ncbi:MAG TPA: SPOR domain-containing protein [Micropepsaceae bacterium]|nr:SPOR domain-containing protein [Micropepsaceae bacterium]